MLDLIPFSDEVCIVEFGRQFLTGGTPDSIMQIPDGTINQALLYIGPCLQEIFFRLFGLYGVRISPILGILAVGLAFNGWLRKTSALRRSTILALTMIATFVPALFQSVVLTRVDPWAVACVFAAMAVLGKPGKPRHAARLSAASFLAALSVFIWPTSAMLAPVYPAFCFDLRSKREFLIFCLGGFISIALILLPALPVLTEAFTATSNYMGNAAKSPSLLEIAFNFAKETARDPLMPIFAAFGLIVWIRKARYMAILAFSAAVLAGACSGLYVFRIIYMMPYLLLMCVDAAEELERTRPRFNAICLWAMAAYGILTGPVGHLLAPHERLPANLTEELARIVGTGAKRVYAPDYATYYAGRELGWRQFAHYRESMDNDPEIIRKSLDKADAVVLRAWDPYRTIQQSCTPYGLLSNYVLEAARREKDSPNKSFAARYGERFANPWHAPFKVHGFREAGTIGPIKVYLRDATKPSPR